MAATDVTAAGGTVVVGGERIGSMATAMRALFLPLLFALGCTTYTSEPACRVGADCASGVCNADGTCDPVTTTTTGGGGTGGGSSSSSSSSSGSSSSSSGTGGEPPGCVPNHDGTVTREEVPLQAGLHATFKVAQAATFDTTGVKNADGSRTWDLTAAITGDHPLVIDTLPLDDSWWFKKNYPAAAAAENAYVARMSDANDLLGVFVLTSSALELHGVASPADSLTATELIFDKPVTVLSFPLTKNKTWTSSINVTGRAAGIIIGGIYTEDYTSTVDAYGTLKTPYADLPVLRVNTELSRFLNGFSTTKRTHAFTSECFGNVGTILSEDSEFSAEFTATAEIWRLSK